MRILRVLAVLVAFAMPLVALAQTSSSPTLASLISQLSALEQQINAMTASTSSGQTGASATAPIPTATNASNNLCPDLSRTLSVGSSGADVAGLQEFLTQQGLFHAIITGYYGTLTAAAVSQWQEQNGVVSGGDAASTGLGVVGPRTRGAMETLCQPAGQNTSTKPQCMQALPPSTECPTSWQPILDPNGCTEYYQCSVSLPNAASSSSGAATSTTSACPVAQRPVCSGTVQTFQTSNGCNAYECVL